MDDLQGLKLVEKRGIYLGIIENSFLDNNRFIIQYHNGYTYKEASIDRSESQGAISRIKKRASRLNIIDERKITHVYHFSPIKNTKSILNHGLLSVEQLKKNGICFENTDPNRYDDELNRISASISFPNYKMRYSLYKNNGIKFLMYDIDPRILLAKLDTQFYYTNAACSTFRSIDKSFLSTNQAFVNMFYEDDRDEELNISYTTDPQAEILVSDSIDGSFIRGVIDEYPNEAVKRLCNDYGMRYNWNSSLYFPRCDHKRW